MPPLPIPNLMHLPQQKPGTGDAASTAVDAAKKWLAEDPARSQGDLATGTGRSRALVSRWIRNDYKEGDNKAVDADVMQFLDRHRREQQASVILRPVETPVYRTTTVALEMAQAGKRLGVIYGEPGCSKTKAAEEFVRRDPKGCLMMMCRYGLGTPKGFLAELVRLLEGKREEIYRQPARMARQVIAKLQERPRFLIINDGHILRFFVFEFLTALIEQCHIGVAIIGHEVMKDNILAGRRIDSEVFDRIADFATFTHVSHKKIETIGDGGKKQTLFAAPGIDHIRQVVKQILPRATKDAVELFADPIVFPSMRTVVNTAVDARGLINNSAEATRCDASFIAGVLRMTRPEF